MIEPAAAELAAERATPADVAAIAEAYARHADGRPRKRGRHRRRPALSPAVLAGAHNELLVQMGGVIGVGLLISFRISIDLVRRVRAAARRGAGGDPHAAAGGGARRDGESAPQYAGVSRARAGRARISSHAMMTMFSTFQARPFTNAAR